MAYPEYENDDENSKVTWEDASYVRGMVPHAHKLPPLVIHPHGQMFGGGHRTAAWRDAGLTHIPAWVPDSHHAAARGYGIGKRAAMISLDLPEGLIHSVDGGVDDHHITVVYLGKDLDDDSFEEACRRAGEAAAKSGPLKGTLEGLGTFPASNSSDGKIPAFVPVNVPGINDLRNALSDLSASEHKDYHPHVTLGYFNEDEPLPPPHPPVPVHFSHLTVHRGEDVRRFPLGGQ